MNLRLRRDEEGIALISILLMMMVLTTLITVVVANTMSELDRSAAGVRRSTAYQAAEAGVDDYIAKLTEDRLYYGHRVADGESTRRPPTGADIAAGNTWTAALTWTYPNGKDAWRRLDNGYEYNLQITPPTAGSPVVTIVSTGRKLNRNNERRAIQVQVRPSSVADFQMIANRDIAYGATATTSGKLYAGIDSSGTKHNIDHAGTASADLFAEGSVTRSPTYLNGATGYNSTNIRTKIKNPINFNNFTGSLVDIQRIAQNGGVYLNDASVQAWKLVFNAAGTVSYQKCTINSGDLAAAAPTCQTATTVNVPTNGAIYVGQSFAVQGVVKGRVTVASNADIVIGADISYVQGGTDVLGLIARQEMIVAKWSPNNLNWRAATIAQTGDWHSYNSDGSHGTMTFTGSTATNLGGYMTMFQTRNYNYDPDLLYLAPPYFPVLEEAYTVLFFRDVAP
jgi:hypothetical protein